MFSAFFILPHGLCLYKDDHRHMRAGMRGCQTLCLTVIFFCSFFVPIRIHIFFCTFPVAVVQILLRLNCAVQIFFKCVNAS